MQKYKTYVFGALLLVVGVLIGWLVKPSNDVTEVDHYAHEHGEVEQDGLIWTCSMHPQIRLEEPGLCPICEMDLVPFDVSSKNEDPTILTMSPEAVKLAQVETTIVGLSGVKPGSSELINVDGTIEMDERTIKSQSSNVSGRLDSMFVNFKGQYVKKGQKVATVYTTGWRTGLLAASQELIAASKYSGTIEGLTDVAIQKLKNWEISDEQIEEIIKTGKPIETIDLYANYSGYVLNKNVSQGDYIELGQVLYTTGKTNNLWLIFDVFESDLASVKKGNNLSFTSPSVSEKTFEAKITYINPILNTQTRTAEVRAEIYNRGNKLKPGMLLKGQITAYGTIKSGAIKIPKTAVLWTGKKSVVYIKVADSEVPTYQFREVLVGNQFGEYVTILEGIESGDEIVTQGAFSIDAAAQLSNKSSMMNRNVTLKNEEGSYVSVNQIESFIQVTPLEFKRQLDAVVQSYLDLKDALTETNTVSASIAADLFQTKLGNIDMSLLKGAAHMYWMDQLKALKAHSSNIKDEVDVEKQRNQFDFVSQAMINSLRAFGTNNKTYYVQHCPMAFDNEGADWISSEEQIRNPYFGDKMMKCGSVTLVLK